MKRAGIIALLLLSSHSFAADTVRFEKKPVVSREGEKLKIEFAANRETDVAVYIENAKGEVVRHLVAGVLGKNPPEPLRANSLEQSVNWDGKDDAGQPAVGGPFKVRVALGLKAGWGGVAFAGKDEGGPNNVSGVNGLVAGADGRVYVLDARGGWCFWYGGSSIHSFRRDGTYERTIKPFASNMPLGQLKATGAFLDEEGRINPIVYRPLGLAFYPTEDVGGQQMGITPDGQLLLAELPAEFGASRPHLALLGTDGSTPQKEFSGPDLGPGIAFAGPQKEKPEVFPALAASADGKSAYLVGLGPKGQNASAVYRVALPARNGLESFFGDPARAGNDDKHLNDPRGVAVDSKGLLYVADFGNNRVVAINEADRAFAGSIQVEAPSWVAVNPKNGAVYVRSKETVIKFSGLKDPKELARLALPPRGNPDYRYKWSLALDTSAEPAVLWIGRNMSSDKFPALLRCEERGDKFTELQKAGCHQGNVYRNPSADTARREVSCAIGGAFSEQFLRLNDSSGDYQKIGLQGGNGYYGWTCVLGPGGQIYRTDFAGAGVARYDHDGKFMPFPVSGPDPLVTTAKNDGRLACHAGSGVKPNRPGVCVDRQGNIYVRTRNPGTSKEFPECYRIDVFAPDGEFLRTAIQEVTFRGMVGPRVDPAGNIYIADAISPAGKPPYPEMFDPHLPDVRVKRWYAYMYGSIIKFPAAGGAVFKNPKAADSTAKKEDVVFVNKPAVLQGALWWRFGFSSQNNVWGNNPDVGDGGCNCTPTEFDVDDFGRVYYPDQGRFRIVVLDTNGNEMFHFGGYGNQDCCGPESYVFDSKEKYYRPRRPDDPKDLVSPFAQPEIGLGWVTGIAVTEEHGYVTDILNRRVLRVKLDYAASETCAVP